MPELQRLSIDHAAAVLAFELANRAWFAESISDRGDDFFANFDEGFDRLLDDQRDGTAAYHVLIEGDSVQGRVNLIFGEAGSAELGYRVARACTGRGLATGVVREVCRLAATDYGRTVVRAGVSTANVASQRVLVKVGFIEIGPADPATIGGRDGSRYELVLD